MNIAIAILGLAILILIHEAGHFFVARAVGMSPRRFYLGFPPALVKVRRKGIEYGIGAIPLGGYVKIPGMHRPAASDVDVQLGPALKEDPSIFPKASRVQTSRPRASTCRSSSARSLRRSSLRPPHGRRNAASTSCVTASARMPTGGSGPGSESRSSSPVRAPTSSSPSRCRSSHT